MQLRVAWGRGYKIKMKSAQLTSRVTCSSLHLETYSRWTKFVEEQAKRWKVHFDWLLKCPDDRDIILVRYEDLKQDLLHEMERILTFLHFPYTCKLLLMKIHVGGP